MPGMDAVRFEPFAETHLDDVAELIRDPDVLRFTRVPDPPPPDFPRQWLTRYEEGRREGTREAFAVVDAGGRFMGLALLVEIDREAREVELGYVVAPAARGRGVATEMLRWLTDRTFAETDAVRITLYIDIENPVSHGVAERCGYVREGVLRSIHFKQDVRIDCTIWSRLRSDPEPASRG